jgi:hypothetical protein
MSGASSRANASPRSGPVGQVHLVTDVLEVHATEQKDVGVIIDHEHSSHG